MSLFDDVDSLIPSPDTDWKLDGLCSREDPDLFFPESAGAARWNNYKAKAVCGKCPVAETCLEEALAKGEWGIWGGTTKDERDDLLAARRRGAA